MVLLNQGVRDLYAAIELQERKRMCPRKAIIYENNINPEKSYQTCTNILSQRYYLLLAQSPAEAGSWSVKVHPQTSLTIFAKLGINALHVVVVKYRFL